MGNPGSTTIGLMNAGVALGGLLFAVPAGYVADRWGRRAGILMGTILFLIGVVMQSAAYNFGTFVGGRVFVGAGIAASITCAPILCQEIAHPRMRGIVGSLYNVMFNVGAIFVAYIAYGTTYLGKSQWAWRIPTILQAAPSLYVLIVLPFLPESPRWLVSKGRFNEAHQMLAKYHANGKMDDELVLFELNEIKTVLEDESHNKTTWFHAFSTSGNRKRFLLLTMVSVITSEFKPPASCSTLKIGVLTLFSYPFSKDWNGKSIVTYYFAAAVKLVGIVNPHQVTGLNAGLNVFNLVGTIIGAGLTEATGRRKMWLTAFIWMLCANIMQTVASAQYAAHKSVNAAAATIAGLFLYSFGFDLACNPLLFTYEVEIMPYYLRSKGLAYGVTLKNIQGVVIQYVNPIGLASLGWKFYLIYLCFLLIWIAVIYIFFPETSGRTLEEVSAVFDGQESILQMRSKADAMVYGATCDEEMITPSTINEKERTLEEAADPVPVMTLDGNQNV